MRNNEELNKLFNLLDQQATIIQKKLTNKPIVLVVGNTGSGKSTFINYLLGHKLVMVKGKLELENLGQANSAPISHEGSGTSNLDLYSSEGVGYQYCDTVGFGDTRGKAESLAARLAPHRLMDNKATIKAIICMLDLRKDIASKSAQGFLRIFKSIHANGVDGTSLASVYNQYVNEYAGSVHFVVKYDNEYEDAEILNFIHSEIQKSIEGDESLNKNQQQAFVKIIKNNLHLFNAYRFKSATNSNPNTLKGIIQSKIAKSKNINLPPFVCTDKEREFLSAILKKYTSAYSHIAEKYKQHEKVIEESKTSISLLEQCLKKLNAEMVKQQKNEKQKAASAGKDNKADLLIDKALLENREDMLEALNAEQESIVNDLLETQAKIKLLKEPQAPNPETAELDVMIKQTIERLSKIEAEIESKEAQSAQVKRRRLNSGSYDMNSMLPMLGFGSNPGLLTGPANPMNSYSGSYPSQLPGFYNRPQNPAIESSVFIPEYSIDDDGFKYLGVTKGTPSEFRSAQNNFTQAYSSAENSANVNSNEYNKIQSIFQNSESSVIRLESRERLRENFQQSQLQQRMFMAFLSRVLEKSEQQQRQIMQDLEKQRKVSELGSLRSASENIKNELSQLRLAKLDHDSQSKTIKTRQLSDLDAHMRFLKVRKDKLPQEILNEKLEVLLLKRQVEKAQSAVNKMDSALAGNLQTVANLAKKEMDEVTEKRRKLELVISSHNDKCERLEARLKDLQPFAEKINDFLLCYTEREPKKFKEQFESFLAAYEEFSTYRHNETVNETQSNSTANVLKNCNRNCLFGQQNPKQDGQDSTKGSIVVLGSESLSDQSDASESDFSEFHPADVRRPDRSISV